MFGFQGKPPPLVKFVYPRDHSIDVTPIELRLLRLFPISFMLDISYES